MTGQRANTAGSSKKHGNAIHITVTAGDRKVTAWCSACDWHGTASAALTHAQVRVVDMWRRHLVLAHDDDEFEYV